MKRKQKFFLLLGLFCLVILISCGSKEEAKREIIRPVRYQIAQFSQGGQTRSFSGVSKAGTEAKLSFRVEGTVAWVDVKVGENIKKGERIAAIDDTDSKLFLEKAKVALEEAKIQNQTAKSNLERAKGLYENNNVSLSEYETAKSTYASANAGFNASKRNLEIQERTLGYYQLYSPIDGVVAKLNIEKNENLTPGIVVAEIHSLSDIEITVGMPESYISLIQVGSSSSIKFPSIPNKSFEGKISEVSFSATSESSTYPITIKLLSPSKELRPGMSADVTFTFSTSQNRKSLLVPQQTVGKDLEGNFVFTLTKTENDFATVHKRYIKLGQLTNDGFEILDGLVEGEYVVTAGISNLVEGMKVKMNK